MKRYGQYCPVARALEVLGERWTMLVVRELLSGEDRFNNIARGVPRMSPSLLAARLRELQRVGLVQRQVVDGEPCYRLTESGLDLEPLVQLMGEWGMRWLQKIRTDELDPVLLMADIKRTANPAGLPERRVTVEFHLPDAEGPLQRWWLVLSRSEAPDVCDVQPGWPVDVFVEAEVRTMTQVWMGDMSWSAALRTSMVRLTGDRTACRSLPEWLGTNKYAGVPRGPVSLPR